VSEVTLVFDERERLELDLTGELATGARRADETHLYRLEARGPTGGVVRTPYARFEVVADEAPEVTIRSPDPFVELTGDRGQALDVVVDVADDYGVGPAHLVATVASGFGELVEFRERRLELQRRGPVAAEEGARVRFETRLDLDALGVRPGVELFFFAAGEDRGPPEPQRGRSATHIVRMPGEGAQSVGLGIGVPILRVPEFFRSQRQIILDTEKLLADEEGLTREEFVRRSEALGFDQRALRMRLGVSSVIGLISGIVPAAVAARMDPVVAIRN
jgi:hypothetical protein